MSSRQKNKQHKAGKHATSGQLDALRKGKPVEPRSGPKGAVGAAMSQSKAERQQRAKQEQKLKRSSLLESRRTGACFCVLAVFWPSRGSLPPDPPSL